MVLRLQGGMHRAAPICHMTGPEHKRRSHPAAWLPGHVWAAEPDGRTARSLSSAFWLDINSATHTHTLSIIHTHTHTHILYVRTCTVSYSSSLGGQSSQCSHHHREQWCLQTPHTFSNSCVFCRGGASPRIATSLTAVLFSSLGGGHVWGFNGLT